MNPQNPIYHVMGTKEAARIWGVSEATVKRGCEDGRVEAVRLDNGRPWIIWKEQPNPFKKHEVESPPGPQIYSNE